MILSLVNKMADYKFKILFANHDGVSVEVSIPESSTGLQLKELLLNNHWPDEKVEKVSGSAGIRLLCMGRMIDDGKILSEQKIPKYEHPTPVNVSLLPKGKTYSEATTHASSAATVKTSSGQSPPSSPHRPQQASGGGGCCTVS